MSQCTASARAIATIDFSAAVRLATSVAGSIWLSISRSAATLAAAHAAPVDQAETPPIAGQHGDVLRDRHGIDETEILVDEGDRQRLRFRSDAAVAIENLAAVARVDAGEDLDEGRFARAVLAEQGMHLAAPDGEVDRVEGQRGGEALGDAAHLQERRGVGSGIRG